MQTCKERTETKLRIKHSLFHGILIPVSSRYSAESALETIRLAHPKANHHCYAFRINPKKPIEFSQDDGEPSGTAGAPILHRLQSEDLVDVLLVVIRYFGGVKLGTGGLIRAYGEVAGNTIEAATRLPLRRFQTFRVQYAYDLESVVQSVLHPFPVIFRERTYLEEIAVELLCPVEVSDQLEPQLRAIRHLVSSLEVGPEVVVADPNHTS